MDAQAWEKAQARLRDLFPDKVLRCKLHKKLTAQPHPERFFDDDDDDATSEALLTLLPEAGMKSSQRQLAYSAIAACRHLFRLQPCLVVTARLAGYC